MDLKISQKTMNTTSIPPSIRGFSNESVCCMRWPKYWSFSFSIIPSKEIAGSRRRNKRPQPRGRLPAPAQAGHSPISGNRRRPVELASVGDLGRLSRAVRRARGAWHRGAGAGSAAARAPDDGRGGGELLNSQNQERTMKK